MFIQTYGNYSPAFAYEKDKLSVLNASIEYNWVNLEQAERDEKIHNYKELLFKDNDIKSMSKKDFQNQYKDFLKDEKFKTSYRLITNGVSETKDYNMAGFFKPYGKSEILYSYALQPKNDLKHIYYYSAMGSLVYIDDIQGNYPEFPYISKQYRANGKLAGVIYYENHDVQYLFKPDGTFRGIWFKEKMFDRKGNQLLTRNNW